MGKLKTKISHVAPGLANSVQTGYCDFCDSLSQKYLGSGLAISRTASLGFNVWKIYFAATR